MVRQIMISLAMLMIISSCKAQNTGSNDFKKNKKIERTTEEFGGKLVLRYIQLK